MNTKMQLVQTVSLGYQGWDWIAACVWSKPSPSCSFSPSCCSRYLLVLNIRATPAKVRTQVSAHCFSAVSREWWISMFPPPDSIFSLSAVVDDFLTQSSKWKSTCKLQRCTTNVYSQTQSISFDIQIYSDLRSFKNISNLKAFHEQDTFHTTMCHVGCCSKGPWAAIVENIVWPALFLTAGRGSTHSSPSLA